MAAEHLLQKFPDYPTCDFPDATTAVIDTCRAMHYKTAIASATSSEWPGMPVVQSPLYPPNSPPLIISSPAGKTPFNLTLKVRNNTGHTTIVGPSGSGKSVLVGLMIAQHFRYKNAQVFSLDRDYSQLVLVRAAGGQHHDLLAEHQAPTFQPLAHIDDESVFEWANEWVRSLLLVQMSEGARLAPEVRIEIERSLRQMRRIPIHARTISVLAGLLTSPWADRPEYFLDMLKPYVSGSKVGDLLDGDKDCIGDSRFQVFGISRLMALSDEQLIPVLSYMFFSINRRLDGSPTLVPMDDIWTVPTHGYFTELLAGILRTFRKKNADVVLSTQRSYGVLGSALGKVVLGNCPTKIWTPHRDAFGAFGGEFQCTTLLTDDELQIIKYAKPSQEYFVSSPDGSRLFTLALDPVQLAFVGSPYGDDVQDATELYEDCPAPAEFAARWLEKTARCLEKKGARWENPEMANWATLLRKKAAEGDFSNTPPQTFSDWQVDTQPKVLH